MFNECGGQVEPLTDIGQLFHFTLLTGHRCAGEEDFKRGSIRYRMNNLQVQAVVERPL